MRQGSIVTVFLVIVQVVSIRVCSQMRQVFRDTNEDNDIRKISFYSGSQGYVATRDWIGFTSDSGKSFIKKYITLDNVDYNGYTVNVTFGFGIKGVKAFTQDSIIVYGDYGLVPAILYSTNGGNSFKLIFHSQFNPNVLRTGITDMIFPQNNNIGFAIDADRILKTVNKGATWTTIWNEQGSYFDYLEAVDNNHVYALCVSGPTKVRRTVDGGTFFGYYVPLPPGHLNYISFLTTNKAWVNMWDDNGDYLYYTSDGGTNWTLKNDQTIQPFSCNKMKFINDSTGYALMDDLYEITKTTDSGKVWQRLPRDSNFTYLGYVHQDLFMYNNQQFWAGGGYGLLELTTNGGGPPLPTALCKVDTTGVHATNLVSLKNYSKPNYQYRWYVNNELVGTSYDASYTHDIYRAADTIMLTVSDGIHSDTSIKYPLFVAVPYPLPIVTAYSPVSGGPGTIVNITGNFFKDASAVSFGGIPATSFSLISYMQIQATVGAGGNGNVTVTTPRGKGSLPGFITFPPPVINSIAPMHGPIGTTVAISGINFDPVANNNTVYFGSVKAVVLNASTTTLTVSVPTGATYEPISVTINNHTCYSAQPFMVTFSTTCGIVDTSFAIAATVSGQSSPAADLALCDMDGDGKTDVLTTSSSGLCVYRNTSSAGSFSGVKQVGIQTGTGGPEMMATGDLDGDGKPDVVVANWYLKTFTVFKNTSVNGAISLQRVFDSATITTPTSVLIRDLDGDGKPDIAIVNGTYVSAYRNISLNGNIEVEPRIDIYSDNLSNFVVAGDVDGDNKPDLVLTTHGSFTHPVLKNTSSIGTISFALPVYIGNTVGLTTREALSDVDGDGKMDLVVIYDGQYSVPSRSLSIYKNTSTSSAISFAPGVIYNPNANPKGLYITDMDGDNKPDLVISFTFNGLFKILKNMCTSSSISFEESGFYSLNNTNDVVAGDMDGDGKPDIMASGGTYGDVIIYQNKLPDTAPYTNTWIGSSGSSWENPANWSCRRIPDNNTNVVINSGTVIVNSNNIIRTLTLAAGVSFTVSPGYTLTVLQ